MQQPADMDYVSTAFLAHLGLAYGPCGDAAMRLIAQATDLYGDVPSCESAVGLRHDCEGCYLASNIKRNQGLHQVKLVEPSPLTAGPENAHNPSFGWRDAPGLLPLSQTHHPHLAPHTVSSLPSPVLPKQEIFRLQPLAAGKQL